MSRRGYGGHVELDVHGFTVPQAIEAFVGLYNREVAAQTRREIHVIHGYGSSGEGGAIRDRLRAYLHRFATHLDWIEGETLQRNPGLTVVRPRRPLPDALSQLASEILAYCQPGKTMGQIINKFRRHGESQLKEAVRELEKTGRLKVVSKGKHKKYEAV